MPASKTRWQLYRERWADGCGSELCPQTCRRENRSGATRICLARGSIPCDILFVGEGPGLSEDVLGQPFTGPAGMLLDQIVAEGLSAHQVPGTEGAEYNSLRWAFTNLVGCLPIDPETGEKAVEPAEPEIRRCSARLLEFVALCRPKIIVCVGKLSQKWFGMSGPKIKHGLEVLPETHLVGITHPAAILRSNLAQRGLAIRRCVVTLQDAVEKCLT